MQASDYFKSAQLNSAIIAASEAVRLAPQDTLKRSFLGELLCIQGDLERADKQLDAMMEQTPEVSLGIMLFRQLIRAEKKRQQCFYEARLPEFIGEVTPALKLNLQAVIALGEKNSKQALYYLQQAELARPLIVGCYNEKPFAGMRDGDDLCAGMLELFTKDGKYYWIALEQINTLELYKPERPIDLIWRRAHLSIHNGPEGEIYIPAIYIQTPSEQESARLGYTTDWYIEQDHPVCGIGQRSFLIGEELISIMEMQSLVIQA